MAAKKPKGEAHVRLYWYEMRTPAWQTLSPDARALLIELRALYRPSQHGVVLLSIRDAMSRLRIGQRRVEAAFDALIDCCWITIETKGSFHLKVRHASEYRLENEPNASPGAVATKRYMRWQPNEKTR